MLTCSHTLSSRSICRNLYMESSLVFCFLVVCQIRSFLVFSFPLLSLSQMYCARGPPQWQRPVTIGEARREIQRRHRRKVLDWLHEQFQSGVQPDSLYELFAA